MIVSLENLNLVIEKLKKLISNKNIVVLLQGDLASGKTTLVKNYVKYLGLDDNVTSPTFSLQSIYGKDIFHYDIYNKTLDEFIGQKHILGKDKALYKLIIQKEIPHLFFYGKPGTGKSVYISELSRIFKEKDIVTIKHHYHINPSDTHSFERINSSSHSYFLK